MASADFYTRVIVDNVGLKVIVNNDPCTLEINFENIRSLQCETTDVTNAHNFV